MALTTDATLLPLKYSPLNNAMDREKGIQKNNARSDVMRVPVMKGNAPKSLLTESQWVEVIKLKNPNAENVLILCETKA